MRRQGSLPWGVRREGKISMEAGLRAAAVRRRKESCATWREERSKTGDAKKWWNRVPDPKEGHEGMQTLPGQTWEPQ